MAMRDEVAKRALGYVEPKSIVRPDGSEKLVGRDWKKRKEELAARSGGRCEWVNSDGERCRSFARDSHHIRARSKGRDDRIENLLAVCGLHHDLYDWKKLHWTIKGQVLEAEQKDAKRCPHHPEVVFHDEEQCPRCQMQEENQLTG